MRILKLSAMIAVLALAAVACTTDSGTTDSTVAPVEGTPGAAIETLGPASPAV